MTREDILKYQDEIDTAFMIRVQNEVTASCALPFALPIERIPDYILQAAQWFWLNSDWCSEERIFLIKNADINSCSVFNKSITLPNQIISVHGVYRASSQMRYGTMGDFSLERMMMQSYSSFGGVGTIGGGISGTAGMTGYNLADVITSMYEVDTFNQALNSPLTYDFNIFSRKLVILGDLKNQDLIINCFTRCKIQNLYDNYYFFRYVVCLVKRALSTIYGSFEFKLPGGIQINYSNFSDAANEEIEKIEEWVNDHNSAASYFFQPNTL